jgi:putative transcriptional regulator
LITIKEARNNKNLTQETLSRLINITLKHYQNIEKGVNIPAVNTALHICEVLEIDPRTVQEWSDRKNSV